MEILSVITNINLDIKPFELAYFLGMKKKYLSFLDSSLYPNKYSKFSYLAWEPDFLIKSYGYKNEFLSFKKNIKVITYQNPLYYLKDYLDKFTVSQNADGRALKTLFINNIDDVKSFKFSDISNIDIAKNDGRALPDFRGGFIGYFSYELKNYIEKLPGNVIDDLNLPVYCFAYYTKILSYRHSDEKWFYIKNYMAGDGSAGRENPGLDKKNIKEDILNNIFSNKSLLINNIEKDSFKIDSKSAKQKIINKYLKINLKNIAFASNFSIKEYIRAVKKAKAYIHDGEVYQINLTQRFKAELPLEPLDLYYILREKNSAPFSCYLNFGEVKIGSSSPERFLFKKGSIIETRPIKGTRPRGKNDKEDSIYVNELKSSIKDRAELNMIVDLERNDLGRFCEYGTVKVSEHAVVEKYARVFHLVSTVTGSIKKGYDIADIIRATFPGGSITGAPKIRAMEIIDELESTVRGIYTGSVGYIGVDNTMDLNIAIRTFIIKNNTFYYNVGGGIVEDSIPEDEYKETLDKGAALQESLKFFEKSNLKKVLKNF